MATELTTESRSLPATIAPNGNGLVPLPREDIELPRKMTLTELEKLGKLMADSGFFADIRTAAQAVVKILAGQEMGFGVFASLSGVHIIEGKPSPGSHLLAAAIRRSGKYDYRVVEHTDQVCRITFLEKKADGWHESGTEALTLKEAIEKRWTVTNAGKPKPTWEKTPKNMLFARVITNGYKFHCPDLSGGVLMYDPDELDYESLPVSLPATPIASLPEPSPAPASPAAQFHAMTSEQMARIDSLVEKLKVPRDAFERRVHELYKVLVPTALNQAQAADLIHRLEKSWIEALVAKLGIASEALSQRLVQLYQVTQLEALRPEQSADLIGKLEAALAAKEAAQKKEGPAEAAPKS